MYQMIAVKLTIAIRATHWRLLTFVSDIEAISREVPRTNVRVREDPTSNSVKVEVMIRVNSSRFLKKTFCSLSADCLGNAPMNTSQLASIKTPSRDSALSLDVDQHKVNSDVRNVVHVGQGQGGQKHPVAADSAVSLP